MENCFITHVVKHLASLVSGILPSIIVFISSSDAFSLALQADVICKNISRSSSEIFWNVVRKVDQILYNISLFIAKTHPACMCRPYERTEQTNNLDEIHIYYQFIGFLWLIEQRWKYPVELGITNLSKSIRFYSWISADPYHHYEYQIK